MLNNATVFDAPVCAHAVSPRCGRTTRSLSTRRSDHRARARANRRGRIAITETRRRIGLIIIAVFSKTSERKIREKWSRSGENLRGRGEIGLNRRPRTKEERESDRCIYPLRRLRYNDDNVVLLKQISRGRKILKGTAETLQLRGRERENN